MRRSWYNIGVTLPIPVTERGASNMYDLLISFIVSVVAGVVAAYICKWLDRYH